MSGVVLLFMFMVILSDAGKNNMGDALPAAVQAERVCTGEFASSEHIDCSDAHSEAEIGMAG
jgi:hypothetical protein